MTATMPDGRLHLLLQPTDEEVYEPDFLTEVPLTRFLAFEDGHRLSGWVRLEADRLTDLLNSCEELHLEEVEIAELDGGGVSFSDVVVVRREALVAVHASGPRGDETQRRPTHTQAIALQSGGYRVAGLLHAVSGTDPIASFQERPPMVPLTEAWIEYWSGDERRHRSSGTIIVNREQVDWVRPAAAHELGTGSGSWRIGLSRR